MFRYSNLISSKKMFWYFLFLSFSLWLIPFVLRLFFIDVGEIKKISTKDLNVATEITSHALKNDNWSVFILIFTNNLKVCLINMTGCVMLGISTMINLIINGFSAADTFATIHENGMEVSKILNHTLPHCFEMIGIWLSGAIGFSIAKVIIDYMRGRELPKSDYLKFIGNWTIITVFIILLAAFVEAYVSMSLMK